LKTVVSRKAMRPKRETMNPVGRQMNRIHVRRIAEVILAIFICIFVARAVPNLNVIPNIPWATQDREIDYKTWGAYTRLQWLSLHPHSPGARTKFNATNSSSAAWT
jgi:hypothetical protein